MLRALNLLTLVNHPCPSLPLTCPSATAKQWHERHQRVLWCVQQYIFLTVSRPYPLPFPLPVRCCHPFPLPILCSRPFPGPCLTKWHVVLTLAAVIVIAIACTTPSTTRRTGINPVLIIMILVDDFIPIEWSNGEELALLVLRAAWPLNVSLRVSLPYQERPSPVN